MLRRGLILAGLLTMGLSACGDTATSAEQPPAQPPSSATAQRGQGSPYELLGTQVWDVPDPVSGRDYQVFVALPPGYDAEPNRRYPVLYVTDADYAFPLLRQITRRVNLDEPMIEAFILVGLSYAVGEGGGASRARDYTPVAINDRTGGGAAYQTYLKTQVLPFIEGRFRADPARRILLGHSYGGLLGAQIMFSEPALFDGYILGSPSFWFGDHAMMRAEADYAQAHTDLPARVYMYIGEYETPGGGRRNNRYDMVGDNARFEARLRSRNYEGLTLSSEVLNDEDHLTVAPRGFTHGLLALLPARD
ncbi:MAG: alpha/beta hydrolase [Brevundimonas sp.]|uniref:alpha/beta hydrolase n=1 Tax=Brevundimonas sp. TaxID=1871086 RepID=UPI00391B3FE9